jgi:hypothetical protein
MDIASPLMEQTNCLSDDVSARRVGYSLDFGGGQFVAENSDSSASLAMVF